MLSIIYRMEDNLVISIYFFLLRALLLLLAKGFCLPVFGRLMCYHTSSSGITHAVFDPHIQNLPIPCANLSTSLHLEARNHAIHPAYPFSPSEVFVSTGICVSRLAQWINVWQCSMVRKTGSACVGGK